MNERTFPGPWSVDQIPQGYRVLDANRRVLAYVVMGDQGTKNHSGGLSPEETRRIARVISSLPDLIEEPPTALTKRSWWKWPVRGLRLVVSRKGDQQGLEEGAENYSLSPPNPPNQ
jgi:hypothetical protein